MGPPPTRWLMLRGLTREARHWGPFPRRLEAALPGAQTFCVDLPGVGTEAGRPSPRTIEAITHDLRRRWLALSAEHPGAWRIVAISLGGMVAADWCGRFADDFEAAVLINTSAGNLSLPHHRMRLGVLPRVLRSSLTRDLSARERLILGFTTRTKHTDERLVNEWAGYAREVQVGRGVALAQVVAAMRFRAPERLSMPSLVLCSEGDELCAHECSRRLAERFGSELRVHPDAGHDLPTDAPEWVASEIVRWHGAGAAVAA